MRTILHVDLNNFYASVECLFDPSVKDKPVAVCGDVELRHGIVLAKNEIAKKSGVKTGYTVSDAERICPGIIILKPHMDRYIDFSHRAKKIYAEYTDNVESFGIDECWLDLGASKYGRETADEIREKIKTELGITASVGVSYNKVFAKLGSDYKKPDATTVISEENYKEIVWRLPIEDMLFVGSSTGKKLKMYGINTIGDLANTDRRVLEALLGKNGYTLHRFANGLDNSTVSRIDEKQAIKSIGNSTTPPRDLISADDIRATLMALSDIVASRLRKHGVKCKTVQISVRKNDLTAYTKQKKLISASYTSDEIFNAAAELYFCGSVPGQKIRSIGIRGTDLVCEMGLQMTFFDDEQKKRSEAREKAIDLIREKYGIYTVTHGINLVDTEITGFFSKDKIDRDDAFNGEYF